MDTYSKIYYYCDVVLVQSQRHYKSQFFRIIFFYLILYKLSIYANHPYQRVRMSQYTKAVKLGRKV